MSDKKPTRILLGRLNGENVTAIGKGAETIKLLVDTLTARNEQMQPVFDRLKAMGIRLQKQGRISMVEGDSFAAKALDFLEKTPLRSVDTSAPIGTEVIKSPGLPHHDIGE